MSWLTDIDHFAQAHEQLVEEYLEEHPHASEDEAYEATADLAYERMQDNLAEYGDWLHEQRRDRMMDEEHGA
jgi:hypothetical protein